MAQGDASSVIIRLTFPGRTRSTLLYFCAVQPSFAGTTLACILPTSFRFSSSSRFCQQPPVTPLCIPFCVCRYRVLSRRPPSRAISVVPRLGLIYLLQPF